MKAYILIKESIPLGFAMVAAAHAGAAILSSWDYKEEVKFWLKNSFRKVVCKITDEEFNRFSGDIIFNDIYYEKQILTESALDGQQVAIVFMPQYEWPQGFKFLKLYK